MNVYADHAATTPMRACAKEAMLEALEDFGNPSSIHSAAGKRQEGSGGTAELPPL